MPEHENLMQAVDQYFRLFDPDQPPAIEATTLLQIEQFKLATNACKTENFITEIENFFAYLTLSHNNIHILKNLYKMILDPNIVEKILMSDDDLIGLLSTQENNILHITPYYLNRILLQGLITDPKKWSTKFEIAFNSCSYESKGNGIQS